jgi:hypothetical protein
MPNELLDPVIGEKIIVDPISEAVISAVQMYSGKFSTADVYRALEPLGLVNKGLTFPIAKRIEDVLSNAGLQSSFDEKKKCTYWSKPKEPDVFDFI